MQKTIELEGAQVLLDSPETGSGTVLLFIPGVSGKAQSDRFLPLVNMAMGKGYAIARVDMWESEETLMELTLARIFDTLDHLCGMLQKEGYSRIIAVGKSFGGGLVLAYVNPLVVGKIGWAPAFSVSETGNMGTLSNVRLESIASVRDIEISVGHIAQFAGPIGIVHGCKDTVVQLANSQAIVRAAEHGTLIEVPGADHSFKTPEAEQALIEATSCLIQ